MVDDAGAEQVDDPVSVIADLNRITTPEGVCETREVSLGGLPQVVSIRGRRRDNPVLVMAHGGPGTPLASTSWMWQRPIEEFFTVVQYDQRAAGRSYALTDPDTVRPTMRVEQYVLDALELVEWVAGELHVDRVVMAGHSWGTVVATRAVVARPELFSAYLGIGQCVAFRQGEQASWRWVRDEAEQRGHGDAAAELDAILPYPGDGPLAVEKVTVEREWVQRFGGFAAGREDCDYFMQGDILSPDYTSADRDSTLAGNELHAQVLLPQLSEVDLTDVTSFPVPIIEFLGRWDYMTPTAPVISWLEKLDAPSKAIEWFEDSAHMAMYEEPGHFLVALLTHVLPHTRRL